MWYLWLLLELRQSHVFTTSSVASSRGKLNTPPICVITLSLHQTTWLASWGSGGLLGAAGCCSPGVMVRWHCDGGLCAVLHAGPRMHHHSACRRWPQGESCTLLLSPLLMLQCNTAVYLRKQFLFVTVLFNGYAIINKRSKLLEISYAVNHLPWMLGSVTHMCKKDVTKNYQTIKCGIRSSLCRENLTGLGASVEGQLDSLSMQPFIMQRLIIILRLLISHWHIAFLNVSRNS